MNTLLYQATLEPQLKGPFPMAIYQNILINVQGILDQLHLIKSVATREVPFMSLYICLPSLTDGVTTGMDAR